MNAKLLRKFGVAAGQPVSRPAGERRRKLPAALDDKLPGRCVRVAAAHPSPRAWHDVRQQELEKAPVEKVA